MTQTADTFRALGVAAASCRLGLFATDRAGGEEAYQTALADFAEAHGRRPTPQEVVAAELDAVKAGEVVGVEEFAPVVGEEGLRALAGFTAPVLTSVRELETGGGHSPSTAHPKRVSDFPANERAQAQATRSLGFGVGALAGIVLRDNRPIVPVVVARILLHEFGVLTLGATVTPLGFLPQTA